MSGFRNPIRNVATLATCLAIAGVSGCANNNQPNLPKDTLTWFESDTAPNAAEHGQPKRLRCTVLRWPNSPLQPGLHPLSEIAALRRTEGRAIPVVALATLPRIADGEVQKGYVTHAPIGHKDDPQFCGLKFGAHNLQANGRFITLDLDIDYTWKDRDVLLAEDADSRVPIPIYASMQTKTTVTFEPSTAMVVGIAGKDHVIIVEFLY